MSGPASLLFVYNADAGLFNTLADIGHKLFSPGTYPCSLCAITHGYLTERSEWRTFVASLGVDCDFLHRDQFRQRFPGAEVSLPAIFQLRGEELRLGADAEAIGACRDLADLQGLIRRSCLPG